MTYLTGKRFKYLGEGNAAGTKTGVIVSEPFREYFPPTPPGPITCVAILWDDGSMEGAIDIELLKIDGIDSGYIVCATWPQDKDGELVMETYMNKSTLRHAQTRANSPRFKTKNPRIAKLHFIEEKK